MGLTDLALRGVFGKGFFIRCQMCLALGQWNDPVPDLAEKAIAYAAGAIAEYWVVDVLNRRLIVHREPVFDECERGGFHYADVVALDPSATVSALAAPLATVRVADLIP